MPKACPICGDPRGWPVRIDEGETEACPYDEVWHSGGARSIHSVASARDWPCRAGYAQALALRQ